MAGRPGLAQDALAEWVAMDPSGQHARGPRLIALGQFTLWSRRMS
jgi:hypothetical protein